MAYGLEKKIWWWGYKLQNYGTIESIRLEEPSNIIKSTLSQEHHYIKQTMALSATSHFEAEHLSGTQKAELRCTVCKNKAALMQCFHSALRESAD